MQSLDHFSEPLQKTKKRESNVLKLVLLLVVLETVSLADMARKAAELKSSSESTALTILSFSGKAVKRSIEMTRKTHTNLRRHTSDGNSW